MRLPLAVPIMSRDGTLDKDSKLVNVYTENKGGRPMVYSRPGISTAANTLAGYGNGIFGGVGLSSATQPTDINTGYVFTGNTFSKIQDDGNLSSGAFSAFQLLSAGISTGSASMPFFFNGDYYVIGYFGNTGKVYKRNSIGSSTEQWELYSDTLSSYVNPYQVAYEHNGYMFIVSPSNGAVHSMAFSANASTWTEFSTLPDDIIGAFVSDNSGGLYMYTGYGNAFYSATPTISSSWVTSSWSNGITGTGINTMNGSAKIGSVHYLIGSTHNAGAVTTYIFESLNASTWTSSAITNLGATTTVGHAGHYRGKFIVTDHAGQVYLSADTTNWALAADTQPSTGFLKRLNGYFNDDAQAMFIPQQLNDSQTSLYTFSSFSAAYTQTEVSTLSNPNNVPIDMIYG